MRRLSRIEPSARNAYALAHESDCARPRQDAGCHVNNAVVGNCFVCIREDEHAVWERFGAYQDELEPGFNCLGFDVCGLVLTTRRVSARVHENVTRCDSKTKDNVFCSVDVAVQLQPKKGSIFQAVYVLASVNRQVDSYVEDLVRAEIPFQTLAGVFAAKDRIATAVHNRLTRTMGLFGWEILNTLVVNVDVPNPGVKAAYNGVMVAQQMKMATEVTAEATKFVTITRAQAERTSDQLQGEGIAKARVCFIRRMILRARASANLHRQLCVPCACGRESCTSLSRSLVHLPACAAVPPCGSAVHTCCELSPPC